MSIKDLLRRRRVAKDAGAVEAAFFAYLRELADQWGIEYADPIRYDLSRVGVTESGVSLWLASEWNTFWVSVYLLDQGDTPEVFVAMSEKRGEHWFADEIADQVDVEVVKELGFDRDAWTETLWASIEKADAGEPEQPVEKAAAYRVLKADDEKRYTLGIAYPADEVDSHGDFTNAAELEEAAWIYMADVVANGGGVGTDHAEGTDGAGIPVESYIYRGPDWLNDDGEPIAKAGDWMVGAIWSEGDWERIKKGELTGWSIQGLAFRDETVEAPEGDDAADD